MKGLKTIDINCDLGEGNDELDCQKDHQLMHFISRCNIACGGHAGNQLTMTKSLTNAKALSLKIGAHPGYPDRENFGRVSMAISIDKLKESLYSQIQTLKTLADSLKVNLTHIKFHGALYNDIERDDRLAKQMVEFCKQQFPSMSLLGLAEGNLKTHCQLQGVPFISEGFMDRRYLSTGKLSPRSVENSVIDNCDEVIKQALALATGDSFTTLENASISLLVDSICLHGDNPNAVKIAESLARAFASHRIVIGKKHS